MAELKQERINAGQSATDTLMKAMEKADRMRTVVVVYDTTDEFEKAEGITGGVIVQDDTKVSSINWMIDQAKRWLLGDCDD
jgi:hypothetical protein